MKEKSIIPSPQKNLRNEIIILQSACGARKEEICTQYGISIRQLNRILAEANEEAEQWFQSLPRQKMIQIFRYNSEKIFGEIQVLEQIRNKEKEPARQFEMTRGIITAYSQYNKLVAEGPSLIRQKEVTEQAEKLMAKK